MSISKFYKQFGALCLILGLVCGVTAKAFGYAACPVHVSLAHQDDPVSDSHAHQHAGAAEGPACSCIDACQTSCDANQLSAPTRRTEGPRNDIRGTAAAGDRFPPAARPTYHHPFATAPPATFC
jgi:hypothetical protein